MTWDTFTGADIYLADNDSGYGLLQGTSAGGRAADSSCVQLQYTIILLTPTPADRWSAEGYSTVWSEISAGNLSNVIDATCLDNGAAVQWTGRTLAPGAGLTIDSGVSFAGSAVPLGAEIPTMSTVGLVCPDRPSGRGGFPAGCGRSRRRPDEASWTARSAGSSGRPLRPPVFFAASGMKATCPLRVVRRTN